MAKTETFEFQTETAELLKLVVGSLYTHKEIFLRELVSNASDALDRLRFEVISRPELVGADHEYVIRLERDAAARTLTVRDSGIGMSRDEVIANIGTIAKSGTRELISQAAASGNAELASKLIGQFGVGFYSVFMVADSVSLLTRKAGEDTATLWESDGGGRYDVSTASRDGCGTTVTLHLKPVDQEAGLEDFTDTFVLERIVRRYSDFITYPIRCLLERREPERNPDGTLKEGGATRTVVEERTLNAMKPIWTRPASEVSEEEYAEFYRHVAHDWTAPLKTLTLKAEGRIEYRALLFVPSQGPLDLGLAAGAFGLQLYAKQVLVMERCEELLEPYLRFVRGVVDAADLPLNVSRETLQQDRHLVQIRKWLSGRILKALDEMRRDEPDTYLSFWRQFGRILKEGLALGSEHRERLQGMLLFASSRDPEALTSLADYVARMQPGQAEIYYLTGDSRKAVESSPHLEAIAGRGIEVLFLTDPVDELMVQSLTEVEGKPLRSAARGVLELGDESERSDAKEALEERGKQLGGLLQALQDRLKDHVSVVRLSRRLTTSPACLVASEQGISPQLERLLRTGPFQVPLQKRILELNPEHAIVARLAERYASNPEDPLLGEGADLLLGYALLAEGSELPDSARFTGLLADLMTRGL